MTLQVMKRISDVHHNLLQYWDIRYKKEAEVAAGNAAVASALAANFTGVSCDNCAVKGHTKDACWAMGGGKEGQAPKWWHAPKGKEPRQAIIDAWKATKAARFEKAVAAAAAVPPHAASAAPAPTHPTAAYTSPMAIYALSTFISDENADEGASPFSHSSHADDNMIPRFGCGKSAPPILNEHVIRTVVDVVDPPSIYAADATPLAADKHGVPTFLDTGASDHCVVNRARFVTYQEIEIEGSTALKQGGDFKVAGKGLAEFVVRIADGSQHIVQMEAIHTPGFAMNLISILTFDTRGLRGSWGNGRLSVLNQDGKIVIDGQIMRKMGRRRLYQVDVVDNKDGGDIVAAIAGRDRNQPTDLETWHPRFGHADVRVIKRMAE
jgi:hypothetical protein